MVEINKSIFGKVKDKITFENKRIFGAILIFLGIIFLILGVDNPLCLILAIIPGIGLCVPRENIKNSKLLGIIFILLMIFLLISLYFNYNYAVNYYINYYYSAATAFNYYGNEGAVMPTGFVIPYILAGIFYIYGIFVSLLYFIETKAKTVIDSSNDINSINLEKTNFCKHCGSKIEKDAKFCPNCGNEI